MLIPALVPELDAATCQELGKLHGEIFRRKYRASVKLFRHAFELLAHSNECQRRSCWPLRLRTMISATNIVNTRL